MDFTIIFLSNSSVEALNELLFSFSVSDISHLTPKEIMLACQMFTDTYHFHSRDDHSVHMQGDLLQIVTPYFKIVLYQNQVYKIKCRPTGCVRKKLSNCYKMYIDKY